MPRQQKSRKPKTSSGNGMKHRKTSLDPVQKVLLGGGLYHKVNKRWRLGATTS